MKLDFGDRIRVKCHDGFEYSGIFIPRPGLDESEYVVLKLESGYNIGIGKKRISEMTVAERSKKSEKEKETAYAAKDSLPDVTIIGTGGTIASKVDYVTGAVHSLSSATEIASAVPGIGEIANISTVQLFNKFSENLAPADWGRIAEKVHEEIKKNASGVVITHGTDTMGYTAAALSFMLRNIDKPVVLTGAQRSSDRGSSDTFENLKCSVRLAGSGMRQGIFVVMHENESDGICAIHAGVRARKMHSSRRDAFETVNDRTIGRIDSGNIEFYENAEKYYRASGDMELNTKIDGRVFLLKYSPGMKTDIFDYLSEKYRGIIIEGTGLGHIHEEFTAPISCATEKGVFVGMTTQTIFGRVNMRVYSTGRKLLKAGVTGLEDMLPEVAYVKLMWVLGQTDDPEKTKDMMLTNFVGEINK